MPLVRTTIADGIARLFLDRPESGNAIDLGMAGALRDVLRDVADDPSVRVVLITGNGPHFCVGGDLRSFAQAPELGSHLSDVTDALHEAITTLAELDAVTIAAVHGSAAGAGLSLVACADLALCDDTARFVSAYARLGLSPDGGGSWYLPRVVGLRRALELTVTNRVLTAEEAREWGLVTQVVPEAMLSATAMDIASEVAAGAADALTAAKYLLRASREQTLDRQLRLEQEALVSNADRYGKEGIAAFLEKRSPEFDASPENDPS